MLGSGGMIVMDEDDCMVNVAKFFLEFTLDLGQALRLAVVVKDTSSTHRRVQ